MPVLRLSTVTRRQGLTVVGPGGHGLPVHRPQFRCLSYLPNTLLPRDAIVDTGSPLTWFPEKLWGGFREGVDFEWLPFAPGTPPQSGQMTDWRFSYRIARFLAPIRLTDLTVQVDRPGVVAGFATGNPPTFAMSQVVVLGLWGGVLDDGTLRVARDPATGSVTGSLEFA